MPTLDILRNEPDLRSYKQGETVFQAGDPGDCMYAVVDGRVEIRLEARSLTTSRPAGCSAKWA